MTTIVYGWLDDGTVARLEMEKRRDAIVRQRLVSEVLKGLKHVGLPASYFVWLPLEQEVRADRVAMALMRARVSVSKAAAFATSSQAPHAIRLALASVEIETLREALATVKRVIDNQT